MCLYPYSGEIATTRDTAAGLAMTEFREKEKPLGSFRVVEGCGTRWEDSQDTFQVAESKSRAVYDHPAGEADKNLIP